MFKHLSAKLLPVIVLFLTSYTIASESIEESNHVEITSISVKSKSDFLIATVPFKEKHYPIKLYRTNVFSKNFQIKTTSRVATVDSIKTYRGLVTGTDIVATALISNGIVSIKIFDGNHTIKAVQNNNKTNATFTITSENHSNDSIDYHEALTNPHLLSLNPNLLTPVV